MPELNAIGHHLQAGLAGAIYAEEVAGKATAHTEKVNIVGAGGALTAAYEQLRNAAENTEEHLLLQNAILLFWYPYHSPKYTISLTALSEIRFPLVVGLLITSPLNTIVVEPPPSRL